MTELLNKAFEAARKLSPEDQDALGSELLQRISADARWEELFEDPRSRTFFAKMAAEVRADIAAGDVDDGDPGGDRVDFGLSVKPLRMGIGSQTDGQDRLPEDQVASGKRPKAGT